jgi:hypothetical protein
MEHSQPAAVPFLSSPAWNFLPSDLSFNPNSTYPRFHSHRVACGYVYSQVAAHPQGSSTSSHEPAGFVLCVSCTLPRQCADSAASDLELDLSAGAAFREPSLGGFSVIFC